MDDFDFKQSMTEIQEMLDRLKKVEEDGVKDILKYFDRMHDNLSNYNNLLIGAFFALAQFQENISRWTVLIPVLNLWFLIWINYRLMEKSRFEASILSQPEDLIIKYEKSGGLTNWLSLLSIISTAFVTLSFLYYLATYQ